MPTTITAQTTARAGLTATYEAAASTMEYDNSGENAFIHIKNANAGTLTLTITTDRTVDGLAVADRTVSILTATEQFIGAFNNADYADSAGLIQLAFDITASVTVAVLKAGSSS